MDRDLYFNRMVGYAYYLLPSCENLPPSWRLTAKKYIDKAIKALWKVNRAILEIEHVKIIV